MAATIAKYNYNNFRTVVMKTMSLMNWSCSLSGFRLNQNHNPAETHTFLHRGHCSTSGCQECRPLQIQCQRGTAIVSRSVRNRNRDLGISRAPLKSQAHRRQLIHERLAYSRALQPSSPAVAPFI